MLKMLQAIDKSWEKRLAANPKLANSPLMRGMIRNIMQRNAGANMQTADFNAKRDAAAGIRPMTQGANRETADFNAKRNAAAGMSTMKKGGKVKKMAKGGSTASKRADGCATKGKTKGRFV